MQNLLKYVNKKVIKFSQIKMNEQKIYFENIFKTEQNIYFLKYIVRCKGVG